MLLRDETEEEARELFNMGVIVERHSHAEGEPCDETCSSNVPTEPQDVEIDRGALCEECEQWENNEDGNPRTFMVCGACWNKLQQSNTALREQLAEYEQCVTCACGRRSWHRKGDEPL